MNTNDMPALDRKLHDDILSITADLKQDYVRKEVDEEVFVKTFLPMFLEAPDRDPRITMATWLNLAAGPFNEVNVVDVNSREVLFVVPPVHDRDYIHALDGTGPDANMPTLSHVMLHAEKLGKRGANVMNNYIDYELKAREFMFGQKRIKPEHARMWVDILTRYKKPIPESLTAAAKGVAAPGTPTSQGNNDNGPAAVDYEML